MTEYRTVFTVLESKPPWQPLVIVVFIAAIGTVAAFIAVTRYKKGKLLVGAIYGIFLLVAISVYPGSGIRDMYQRAQTGYLQGQYETVEGEVREFHPMPYSGHQDETFVVKGVRFTYSDFVIVPCFNTSTSHGGPIREGLRVRIAYAGNCILRLDVANSSR